ncbi:MAG: toprim domain-containing protein [Cellulophaga sp.]
MREKDTTPSFKVDIEKNLWFDFGLDIGGNILDLVMRYQGKTFKQALKALEVTGLYQGSIDKIQLENMEIRVIDKKIVQKTKPYKKVAGEKEKDYGFDILKVCEIDSVSLYDYLTLRAIDYEVATKYLKQINYAPKGQKKGYFALAWNCGNGYEARSGSFKGFIGTKKDLIKVNLKDNQTLSIFEGFMDFLSFLTYYDKKDFQNSVIILNSINLKRKALKEIEKYKFTKIYIFLDNDKAGQETKGFFQNYINYIPVLDMSYLYKNYKDFNQMLIESK